MMDVRLPQCRDPRSLLQEEAGLALPNEILNLHETAPTGRDGQGWPKKTENERALNLNPKRKVDNTVVL